MPRSLCWSGFVGQGHWRPLRQVNYDITIVFPAPELVCTNIYMVSVNVPAFSPSYVGATGTAATSPSQKNMSDPMNTPGWRQITQSTHYSGSIMVLGSGIFLAGRQILWCACRLSVSVSLRVRALPIPGPHRRQVVGCVLCFI